MQKRAHLHCYAAGVRACARWRRARAPPPTGLRSSLISTACIYLHIHSHIIQRQRPLSGICPLSIFLLSFILWSYIGLSFCLLHSHFFPFIRYFTTIFAFFIIYLVSLAFLINNFITDYIYGHRISTGSSQDLLNRSGVSSCTVASAEPATRVQHGSVKRVRCVRPNRTLRSGNGVTRPQNV